MKWRRRIFLSALVLAGVALGAFAASWWYTPPSFDLRAISYPRAVREDADMPVVEVLFVTNRRALGGEEGDAKFADEPGEGITYGRAEVRIPANYTQGDTQRPEIPRRQIDEERATVQSVTVLTKEEFEKALAARMAGHEADGATVFVHGMNHSFDSSVRAAGALSFSLNLDQPMILFAWPSQPGLSASGYRRSAGAVDPSGSALAEFLGPHRTSKFDILSHSMGCRVVCKAFDRLMGLGDWSAPDKDLPNVIFAAPDVDSADFGEKFLGQVQALTGRATVYVARNDKALVMSSFLNGAGRAGTSFVDPGSPVASLLDLSAGDAATVEIVDATFVNSLATSHGYFYQSRANFADLYNLLRHNLPASQRQLLRHEKAPQANYWIIPP